MQSGLCAVGKFVEMVPKVVHLEKVNEGVFMINPHFMEHLKDTHEEMEAMKGQMREALCQVGRKIDREPDKGVKLENHPNHGYCFKVPVLLLKYTASHWSIIIWH